MSKYIKPTLVILGREIRTIEVNGTHYVSARGVTSVFDLNWRKQKQRLLVKDSVILYGVIDISAPEYADIVTLGSGYLSRSDMDDTLFMRMDRAMMYIARVSTAQMRVNGKNESGADAILSKQIEFAQALHDYETFGIAINKNHWGQSEVLRKQRLAVVALINAKNKASDKADRQLLETMIRTAADECNAPYQPDLVDGK